ncbi:DegT/DnrJ/EryC1/StrS family aminotransferase [Myroides ceti]|uniref:DegT/DnrJ/EryC1/StrS family aminotransferase n=1 Tax=Paenimyroides ceti TaxID=395087 RepID=A0ABT8CUU1_9FLAO|nr:DegT/DnrJ/EryC1/StrS family aminotransferase [Paenimyroides ceti]MDN3707761.1 DegT/DnrJ/EryC1/StrS family aminotransferase [Paenimyroides ceti]
MGITKIATKKNIAQREWKYTNSAREAWSTILDILKKENPQYKVLLPAYIGWSPNEGSGIFDSVKNSSLDFDFYNLDRNLKIDFNHFKNKIKDTKDCIVLLVHYFGFPDVQYQEIINWLDQNNILYIEDCAHSWLTDLIGGICGRNGRFAFYSLHKMLPVSGGGLWLIMCQIKIINQKYFSPILIWDMIYSLSIINEEKIMIT